MKKLMMVLCALTLILVLNGCSNRTEWAHWRGPNSDGTTDDTDWSPEALKDGARILWQAEVGKGHSSVTIQGNRVYTMGNRQTVTGSDTVEQDIVYCFNAKTGKTIWTHDYECPAKNWPGPCATPVIDGKRLYIVSRVGHLFCTNNRNGTIIWQKHLVEDSLAQGNLFAASAVIDEDRLLLNINRSGAAFNKFSGELVWTSEITDALPSTPVIHEHNGRRLAWVYDRRSLIGVDSQTGEVVYEADIRPATCDPVIMDDHVLHMGRHTVLLKMGEDRLEEVWKNEEVTWSFQNGVVVHNHLYGFTMCDWQASEQPFHCFDLEKGEVRWEKNLVVWGSLIAADDKLVILEGQGRIVIADASPEGLEIIAAAQVVPMSDNTRLQVNDQCHCWTHPVLAGGKLYARNNFGTLVCVDMRI